MTHLSRLLRIAGLALFALLPLSGAGHAAPQSAEVFEGVRAADLRLAAIGWRLAAANAALCDRREPGTGIVFHTLDQFGAAERGNAASHFGFATPVAIEGVIAGSPAERAGLRQDDSLVRIGTVAIAELNGKPGTTDRLVAAQLAVAALPPEAPLAITVLRKGTPIDVVVQPVPLCRSRFELKLGSAYAASADGTMVQIGLPFLEAYPEEETAAAVAHEFAHNILRHRVRLEARGVDFGMLSGFGANVKYFRETEIQADLLAIYLLHNAGYPPQSALRFWRKFGPSKAGGIFRSRSHPHWRDRVRTMEAEIAKIGPDATRPLVPALIAQRDQPLQGDWEALLVRN